MATLMQIHNLNTGYLQVVEAVLLGGKTVSPRGKPVRELRGFMLEVQNPYGSMPLGVRGRRANAAIGVAEALQLISGRSFPQMMARITREFKKFMDGEILQGAYGPRIRAQLPLVVELLREDPDTRQAVLEVWDPMSDLFNGAGGQSQDVACTLGLQFILRNEYLHVHSTMRSQDVWLGLAYDIFMFSELLGTVAHLLGARVGSVTHTVGSLHLYDEHAAAAESAIIVGHDSNFSFANGIGVGANLPAQTKTRDAQKRAEMLLRGIMPHDIDDHERWMLGALNPYLYRQTDHRQDPPHPPGTALSIEEGTG